LIVMGGKTLFGAMVAGAALVILVGAHSHRSGEDHEASPEPPLEAPWLSAKAAAELVGPDGSLGPLFDGVSLGGPAPSREARARIAAFARANRVEIDLEVVDHELAAVRFAVTFGGCCGYEGADVMSLRMGRPRTSECCGCEKEWIDDWAVTSDTGVHMRARVRVNRVLVRWERTTTLPDVLQRADGLLGMRVADARRSAGDHWKEIDPDRYLLEMPYEFARYWGGPGSRLRNRHDLGLQVRAESGTIVEVSLAPNIDVDGAEIATLTKPLWGRSRIIEDTYTWRTSDRIVTVESSPTKLTIARR
jgi:hypothetical protein